MSCNKIQIATPAWLPCGQHLLARLDWPQLDATHSCTLAQYHFQQLQRYEYWWFVLPVYPGNKIACGSTQFASHLGTLGYWLIVLASVIGGFSANSYCYNENSFIAILLSCNSNLSSKCFRVAAGSDFASISCS
ncbi:hypothetical protein ACLKA6_003434 [Drosophila palustris]